MSAPLSAQISDDVVHAIDECAREDSDVVIACDRLADDEDEVISSAELRKRLVRRG